MLSVCRESGYRLLVATPGDPLTFYGHDIPAQL